MQPSDPRLVDATPEAIDRAVALLRAGGLVAFPTETVYGLGADASLPGAVRRIFAAKGRPADHPVIVHLPGIDALDRWATGITDEAAALAGAFWPGPLTLVLPRSSRVPDVVTGGRPTVGLRVPDQPVARQLLEGLGDGIAAPSANRFGRVSPTSGEHVLADLGADVDLVLDGGPCRVGVESTIVEVVDGAVTVLRIGAVTAEDVEAAIGRRVQHGQSGVPRAPGMLRSHYAPDARVVLAEESAVGEVAGSWLSSGHRVAVLAERPPNGLPDGVVLLEPVGDSEGYARHLYQRLRQADRQGIEVVVAVPPEATGIGAAVDDRLRRASRGA